MPRKPVDRLTLEEAETLCGARPLRALAGTPQTYTNWRERGVPWDVTGPLILEQLSQASAAHSQLARHGGPDMHSVLDAQGRVFQIARTYGVESKEFQAVKQLLTLFAPDVANLNGSTAPHSVAAATPQRSAAVALPARSGTRAPRRKSRGQV